MPIFLTRRRRRALLRWCCFGGAAEEDDDDERRPLYGACERCVREDEECPICFETTSLVRLKCEHAFCVECVRSWYRVPRAKDEPCRCPLCRRKIRSRVIAALI